MANRITFQFTTSRGGRPAGRSACTEKLRLSIHDLTRRSTVEPDLIIIPRYPFNSRPHEEVDKTGKPVIGYHILSIHDLTRRSTNNIEAVGTKVALSIHDLTRRSTVKMGCSWQWTHTFNSRPHEEVDSKYLQYFVNNWLNYWLLHLKRNFFLPLHAQIFYHHFYYLLNYWCESLSISCPLHIRTRKSTFLLHQN